jgi:hypothetical protein
MIGLIVRYLFRIIGFDFILGQLVNL